MNTAIKTLRLASAAALSLTIATFAPQMHAQSLGTAENFAVLGASTVTNTGASLITSSVGVSPGSAITGFPPGIITGGALHAADATATTAHADFATAYTAFAGLPSLPANNLSGTDLGGRTLKPGVYRFDTSATSGGALTFDAQGDSTARFVIQIGTTFITSSSSSVALINGADARNVYFQVGTSATLGSGSSFIGNILAGASVTTVSGTTVTGRLLALTGAVTLDTNKVTSPGLTPGPTPTPAPTITPTPTATPTPTPIVSPSPTATPSPTISPFPTASPLPTASPTPTPPPGPSELLNISARLKIQGGDNVSIAGFIITGNAPKKVLIRGLGPSLTGLSPAMADPMLELREQNGSLIIRNDNWKDTQSREIQATGLAPTKDLEAAIVVTLPPGDYTAILRSTGGNSGIGLIELYDLTPASDSALGNMSTRGLVETGQDVMIGGFIFGHGTQSEKVIVRALGPSLTGIASLLADPILALYDANGMLVIADDNWKDDAAQAALILATGLAPRNDSEAAVVATLPPAAYTAIISGKNGSSGVALAEVYHLP